MREIEEIKADIEKAKHCEKIRNKSRNICNNSPCKTCEFDTVSICRLNEQLQAQNAAMKEALEWAGSTLGQSPCLCRADSECMRCQALTAIDKAGGEGV